MTQARTMVKPAALIAILVVVAIVVFQAQMAPQPLAQVEREGVEIEAGEGEAYPPALSRHLEELSRLLPGNQGMAEEGPGSAAEAAFMARAYPADTISVAEMDRARTAFIKAKKRAFPRGKPKPGTWGMCWAEPGPVSVRGAAHVRSVRTERVHRRRTDDRQRARADLRSWQLLHVHRGRRRWRVAHEERPGR